MLFGAGRFSPLPPDSHKTLVDYAMCVDPKINLPQRFIDTCIAYVIHRDSIFSRKYAERKLRRSVRSQKSVKTSDTVEN